MNQNSTNVERAVQVSMALMSSLGTMLLGLGQQSFFLPMIAILGATGSVVLTDIQRRFVLHRNIANIAALLAVAYALSDFFGREDSETQLLAIANLLVYLQVVLQFQEKSLRVYWSLSVLSLLQVVVASALHLSFSFGPLLFVYLLVALTSLSLLFVLREACRFRRREEQASPADEDSPLPSPKGKAPRWPLSGARTVWSGATREDPARPLVGRRLARQVCTMGLATLLVTVLVFYGVPRNRRNAAQLTVAGGASITGFTDEVSLGEMGPILQSEDPVLRVTFKDAQTKSPFQVTGDPYLRGATLSHYERRRDRTGAPRHRWVSWGGGNQGALDSALPGQAEVIQDITLETAIHPRRNNPRVALFSTFPAFADAGTPAGLELDPVGQQLQIEADVLPNDGHQFRYTIRSGAFRDTVQSRLTREWRRYADAQLDEDLAQSVFPRLVAVAEEVVQQAGATDPMTTAMALESHFRTPGNYEYSLDPEVVRNPELDPVEDFVANHRTGHCEYFASALVLMLRSQGIPARMVVGYKGGAFNKVGEYYQVRQKHAHAWVEAYLAPGEFPAEQLVDAEVLGTQHGAWLRLDPTPADAELDEAAIAIPLLEQLGDVLDYVQILWTDYVLGLNSDRQRTAIYQPLVEAASGFWESLGNWQFSSPAPSPLWLTLLLVALFTLLLIWNWERVFGTPRGAVLEFMTTPVRWIKQWLALRGAHGAAGPQVLVDFYQRLERVLQAHGLRREPQQTQREFAIAAGGRLADVPHLQPVAGVPRRVVEAFYRVRFGQTPLDNSERLAVEQALGDLETALREK
jgi:hypothetical protein